MTEVIEKTDLVALPPKEGVLTVFTKEHGLDPYLEKIRNTSFDLLKKEGASLSTKSGRAVYASVAYKVAQMKTKLDNLGKEETARLQKIPIKINAERKRVREALESLQAEIRKPLTEWEQAESERIRKHEEGIAQLRQLGKGYESLSSATISERIAQIKTIQLGEHWQEYEATAGRIKDETLTVLNQAFENAKADEERQAELARLKFEAIAREQKEREERIAAEAKQAERKRVEDAHAAEKARLQLEAERAKRKEQEAKIAAEKAKKEAEAKAKKAAENERRRIEEEKAKAEEEARKREANKKHRQKIIGEATHALVEHANLDQETADLVITLVNAGMVPHVSISF